MSFDVLVATIVGFCLAWAYSYWKEKGKNQALLQDSGQLTQIIEGVKVDFIKEIELFKADLNRQMLEHQTKFSHFHNRQAEVVSDLYKALFAAETALRRLLISPDPDESADVSPTVTSLWDYYGQHRIYFNDSDLRNSLEHVRDLMWQTLRDQESLHLVGSQKRAVLLQEAWSELEEGIRIARDHMESFIHRIWS